MELEKLEDLAKQIGFTTVGKINMEALVPMAEIRAMCNSDRCKNYNHSWSCPPACGSVEETETIISRCTAGILVQTVGKLEDNFDFDGMKKAEAEHKKKFDTLARQAKMLDKNCVPMSSGTCRRCSKCTYPDRPCRFPEKVFPSMEAYGFWVSDVCTKSGIKYNYGENTISYTACILI